MTNIQFHKLHDAVYDIFEIDLCRKQLDMLFKLVHTDDAQTVLLDDLLNLICIKYVGMKIPVFGSSEVYKNDFYRAVGQKTVDLLKDLEYKELIDDEEN